MTDNAEEEALGDPAEMLFRQVHPNWVIDGEPSSQAFRPTSKDDGQLSVSRGSKTTAEAAYVRHVDDLGLGSAGTWGVTVAEVRDATLSAIDDPLDDDPAHAFVDFRGLGRGASEAKAKVLKARARARGALYVAPQDPGS